MNRPEQDFGVMRGCVTDLAIEEQAGGGVRSLHVQITLDGGGDPLVWIVCRPERVVLRLGDSIEAACLHVDDSACVYALRNLADGCIYQGVPLHTRAFSVMAPLLGGILVVLDGSSWLLGRRVPEVFEAVALLALLLFIGSVVGAGYLAWQEYFGSHCLPGGTARFKAARAALHLPVDGALRLVEM